jgi:hypothetical protein
LVVVDVVGVAGSSGAGASPVGVGGDSDPGPSLVCTLGTG